MALLKYGRQIIGLSRSQQQLGFGRFLTTKSHRRCLCAFDTSTDDDKLKYGREIIGLPRCQQPSPPSFNGFFSNLFRKNDSTPAPPTPGPITPAELLGKIMDLAEKIKSCPEENPHLDEISPFLKELLGRVTDGTMVKLLYELARPAASPSSPPIVIDSKVKDFVDNLPTNIIPFFQDMTVYMVEARYRRILNRDISCSCLHPTTVSVTADVSGIGKERLKVFVVGDLVMVTGTDKASVVPYSCRPTPKQMVKFPRFPYLHDKVTASIIRDQLKIVFPCLDDSAVVNIPRVFQLNLDSKGTFQG